MMKKRIVLVLSFVACLSLCSCAQECSCDCSVCCDRKVTVEDSVVNETEKDISDVFSTTDSVETGNVALAVEDFEITKFEGDELWFKVKIRNISDRDLVRFSFQYQMLDKNGDILEYQLCGAHSVVAGQAIWAGDFSVRDLKLEEVEAMSFVSDWSTDSPQLKERVVFLIDEYR